MTRKIIVAAGLAALLLAACDDGPEDDAARQGTEGQATENGAPPADATPGQTSGDRARDALNDAARSAGDAARSLGEAGEAAWDSLQENAPEVRESLENAGDRMRRATDALMNDPDPRAPADAEGDNAADSDDVPETQEPPPQ